MKVNDLSGQRFGALVVVDRAPPLEVKRKGHTFARWNCVCDCGARVIASRLNPGRFTSCGCVPAGHGHSRTPTRKGTPTWSSWRGMTYRCVRKLHKSSKNYRDRGIAVCERWHVFANFLADMGERPEGMTLDRKNNDLGYSPENCRWATRSEQMRNTRRTKLNEMLVLEIHGRYEHGESLSSIARRIGVSANTVGNVRAGRTWKELR